MAVHHVIFSGCLTHVKSCVRFVYAIPPNVCPPGLHVSQATAASGGSQCTQCVSHDEPAAKHMIRQAGRHSCAGETLLSQQRPTPLADQSHELKPLAVRRTRGLGSRGWRLPLRRVRLLRWRSAPTARPRLPGSGSAAGRAGCRTAAAARRTAASHPAPGGTRRIKGSRYMSCCCEN